MMYGCPIKVELGVKVLETLSEHSTPMLYSSSFQYCDENLNVTGNPINLPERIHLKDVFVLYPCLRFLQFLSIKHYEMLPSALPLTGTTLMTAGVRR